MVFTCDHLSNRNNNTNSFVGKLLNMELSYQITLKYWIAIHFTCCMKYVFNFVTYLKFQ